MRMRVTLLLCAAIGAACSDQGPNGSADPCVLHRFEGVANASFNSSGVLTVSPIPLTSIANITPLGNLNPPEHVYPTDHAYLNLANNTAGGTVTVSAAAAGTIVELYKPGGSDWKMVVQVDKSFFYYYDHIVPAAGLVEGSAVTAGQTVGTNSGPPAAAVDLGVYNFNNPPLAGILNECAARGVLGVDSPLKYFTPALQTQLYGKVNVSGAATKDGKIDYDQAGKLVGNWVLAGHRPTDSPSNLLAFTYNVSSHGPRVSAGSALGGGGSFAISIETGDFATITPASGQVNYRVYPTCCGDSSPAAPQSGVVAVQMLSATSIKVEYFPGNLTGTATFTANALTYER